MPPAFTLSQDQTLRFISARQRHPKATHLKTTLSKHQRTDPNSMVRPDPRWLSPPCPGTASKRTVTHQKDTLRTPQSQTNRIQVLLKPRPPIRPLDQPRARAQNPRAPPTYPFLAYATVKDRSEITCGPAPCGPIDRLALMCAKPGAEQET
jgi:hypothetical protein